MTVLRLTGVCLVLAACVVSGQSKLRPQDFGMTPAPAAEIPRIRAAILEELRPVTLRNCELTRVGGVNDGGYLMCRNLMAGIQTAYSYGIGTDDHWGCQVSTTHKVPVHQYDCFKPTKVTCPGAIFRLNAECVGSKAETVDGRFFDTIANQITKNGDVGKKMVVKIDIEGAEWDAILSTPDAVLAGIDQMPMELHGLDSAKIVDGIRKLKRHFHLVFVHFNNYACSPDAAPLPAFAYQVLFVNKRLGAVGTPPPGWPTADSLAAPDNPNGPDCQPKK